MKRRWVKVSAITVVVLAVLFTVADRVCVHYANDEAARLVKEKYGYGNTTDGRLDVSIEGFPFLCADAVGGQRGSVRVSQAPGSAGQAAHVKVTGTVGGTALNSTGTLLAQGTELSLTVPGAERASAVWRVRLPEGVGFTSARATADGVEIGMVGHRVNLGSSRFTR